MFFNVYLSTMTEHNSDNYVAKAQFYGVAFKLQAGFVSRLSIKNVFQKQFK